MTARVAAAVLLGVFVHGCRLSRPARFYTLTSVVSPAPSQSKLFIVVGPVSVPGTVDRAEMVVSAGANELRVDEFHRWASSLQDNLSRVVAQNLATMVGTPRVVLSAEASNAEPDYRVAIEVLAFDSSLGRFAALDAVWTVRRSGNGPSETRRTSVRENVADATYEALAAAHSRTVAQMSRQIADCIQKMALAGRASLDDASHEQGRPTQFAVPIIPRARRATAFASALARADGVGQRLAPEVTRSPRPKARATSSQRALAVLPSVAMMVHGPWQIAATGLLASKNALVNATAFRITRSRSEFMTAPGSSSAPNSCGCAWSSAMSTANSSP